MRLGTYGLIFAGLIALVAVARAQSDQGTAAGPYDTGPTPFPSRVLRQTTFNIPFTVETARQPLEVQLYLSRDRGQTWKLYARQNPSARFFPFHATQDGEYWFASQTIDATRAPADMDGRQPELHVVIDTVQPQFDFQAVISPARQIQVSWRCSDPTIDPSTLKIEYQTGREQPWQPVTAQSVSNSSSASGHLTFTPSTAWVELNLRAEISDLARNKAVVSRRLTLAAGAGQPSQQRPTWRPLATRSPPSPDRPVALPPTTPENADPGPASAPNMRAASGMRGFQYPVSYGKPPIGYGPTAPYDGAAAAGIPADPYANSNPSAANAQPGTTYGQPGPGENRLSAANNTAGFATNQADDTTVPLEAASTQPLGQATDIRPSATAQSMATDVAPTVEWKSTSPATRVAGIYGASTSEDRDDASSPDHELAPDGGYQAQPSQVNPLVSQQIGAPSGRYGAVPPASGPPSVRRDLDATAPSPLRSDSNQVAIRQLRMTSATRFELDYDFDAAAANGVRSVELWGTRDQGQTWSHWHDDDDRQSPLDVEIDAEGIYGFRIVIVGNNGLAGDAPRNGDDAELWVGVDTTSPTVRITTATYGEGEHTGQLDIRWTAADAAFGESPITILFSDHPDGPWTTIAAGVPNSGQHYWPIDPRAPEQLFLRIEARDRAGNQGEYRLPDPINLSGFTPKARIRGIRPVTSAPRSYTPELDSSPQATRNPYVVR